MFGNKYMAEELARNYQAKVDSLKKAKKANEEAIKKSAMDQTPKAEDFLIDSSNAEDPYSKALDKKIHNMSKDMKSKDMKSKSKPPKNKAENCAMCGYAHDKMSGCASDKVMKNKAENCSMCGYAHDKMSECYSDDKDMAWDKSASKSTVDQYINKKAQYVLFELGKVASELRQGGNGFAADMVEATAVDIKNEEVQKVAGKLQVISGLTKMAKESYTEGDFFTGDVIQATINNIKKS